MGSGGGGLGGIASGGQSGGPMGAWGAYEAQQGANRAASAAQRAAQAQQHIANLMYKEVKGIVNPATVAGLASLDRDIKNQEKNLSRQEALISQIDPTIIEASQQALRLLRGEESSAMGPLKQQRDMQRQKLVNSLREQLGPGAETSTAGIQALTRFDAESGNLFSGAQQNMLASLGNLSTQFTSQRPDMFREIAGLSNFGQSKADLSFRQASALNQARSGQMQTAGAQFIGDQMRGQYQQQMGGMMQQQAAANQQQAMQIGASFLSDARAKTDLVLLSSDLYEVPVYLFRYRDEKNGKGWFSGVMAQDLLAKDKNHPAVSKGADGYYRVNYYKVRPAA